MAAGSSCLVGASIFVLRSGRKWLKTQHSQSRASAPLLFVIKTIKLYPLMQQGHSMATFTRLWFAETRTNASPSPVDHSTAFPSFKLYVKTCFLGDPLPESLKIHKSHHHAHQAHCVFADTSGWWTVKQHCSGSPKTRDWFQGCQQIIAILCESLHHIGLSLLSSEV